MKHTIYTITFILGIIAIASCGSSNNNFQKDKEAGRDIVENDTIRIANDSLEYEIIIIEPGFYGWLATQPPRGYYAQSAMEIRNYFNVTEYNLRVLNPLRFDPNLYPFRIDYDQNTDYGYEVNYLLYNYFLFFEKRYNQRLR